MTIELPVFKFFKFVVAAESVKLHELISVASTRCEDTKT